MVVSYKTGWLTHAIISRMLKVPYVSLPNLLAGRELVPEVLQDDATAQRLAELLLARLGDSALTIKLRSDFTQIHQQIKCNGNEKAAEAVLSVITKQVV
jgi:lipid-A-disaccharide synthase